MIQAQPTTTTQVPPAQNRPVERPARRSGAFVAILIIAIAVAAQRRRRRRAAQAERENVPPPPPP